MQFSTAVKSTVLDVRCTLQCTKRFIVPSVGGTTRIANLWWKFSKTWKKSAAELCQILRMVTFEIVINSTHVMSIYA